MLAVRVVLVVLFPTAAAFAQEGDVAGVHDPCIVKAGDSFHVFSTHGGIQVRESPDLFHWRRAGRVFEESPAWAVERLPGYRNDPWAPDVAFFKGEYRLYYSVSSWGRNRSMIGLAANRTLDRASPDFQWRDEGIVIESRPGRDDFNCIDPNLVLDERGRPWLAFGSYFSGIQLVALDRDGRRAVGEPFALARREAGVEAPFIVRREPYYYLFVSIDRCCRGVDSTYKVAVGRSRGLGGPYVDRDGARMLDGGGSVVLQGRGRYRGPGHNAVLGENGRDYLIHHFYDADRGGRSTLQIRDLTWSRDGWPVVGEPIAGGVDAR